MTCINEITHKFHFVFFTSMFHYFTLLKKEFPLRSTMFAAETNGMELGFQKNIYNCTNKPLGH